MSEIGQKVRKALSEKDMSIANLAKRSKLSQSTVDNIIYGRSKKIETVKKIAKALGLPLEYFISSDAIGGNFNAALYHRSFNIVYKVLVEHNVLMNKEILDEYCYDAFLFAKKEANISERNIELYAKGLIFSGIKQGKLAIKN